MIARNRTARWAAFAIVAGLPGFPAAAQQNGAGLPRLTLVQEAAVRCGAAFAIVSADQARGVPIAGWPPLGVRGKEFFVRTGARVMDETGATRDQVQALFARAASELVVGTPAPTARLELLRGPCLSMLAAMPEARPDAR